MLAAGVQELKPIEKPTAITSGVDAAMFDPFKPQTIEQTVKDMPMTSVTQPTAPSMAPSATIMDSFDIHPMGMQYTLYKLILISNKLMLITEY